MQKKRAGRKAQPEQDTDKPGHNVRSDNMKPYKIVKSHLNKIYREAVKIAGYFEDSRINLNMLAEILKQAKVSEETTNDQINQHNKKFNDLLDKLLDVMKNKAKVSGTNSVSVLALKKSIEAINRGYKSGMKK